MEKCADAKCPHHGGLRVRGKIMEGVVVSDKPKNTVILEHEYLNFVPKYERYERRTTRIAAHKPACMDVKAGDTVRVGECRKLSKTKAFVVIEKIGVKK